MASGTRPCASTTAMGCAIPTCSASPRCQPGSIRSTSRKTEGRSRWSRRSLLSSVGDVSFGSWLCKNALAEALRRGDFEEVAAFDHFAVFGAFSFLKRSVAKAELPWARLQGTNDVSVDYALIAARSGWTPMMFITRVRL